MRGSCTQRCYSGLGWARQSGTLCCTCKAEGSADIPSFHVNTVQHTSAIESSAIMLTGCSHSPKTMMLELTDPNSMSFGADLSLTMKCAIMSLNLHRALTASLLSFSICVQKRRISGKQSTQSYSLTYSRLKSFLHSLGLYAVPDPWDPYFGIFGASGFMLDKEFGRIKLNEPRLQNSCY